MVDQTESIEHTHSGGTSSADNSARCFGNINCWSSLHADPEPTHKQIELWLERLGLNPTRRQLRRALLSMPGRQGGETLLDEAEAVAADPEIPREARAGWQDALIHQRLGAWTDIFTSRLQLTEDETDQVFRSAVAIHC